MAYSTFPLVDRVTGGVLAERLAEWQAAGISPERMSALLYAEFDVHVSYRTIYRWLKNDELAS